MPSALRHVTVDVAPPYEPYDLALFWSQVLGRPVADDDAPGDDEALVALPGGLGMLFVRVPEAKTAKNRVHVDLRPDTTRDAEVDRLVALGAALVDDQRRPDGTGWVVLGDPAGNEFCVERGPADR